MTALEVRPNSRLFAIRTSESPTPYSSDLCHTAFLWRKTVQALHYWEKFIFRHYWKALLPNRSEGKA
ncbi:MULTISPECIES: hypothetical protein [unclassified Rhizobium]|uniref:hypothetical protein n=1 Tax=unclassified Rhizobium TaxID=2613769 RepID=UPI001130E08D|nr:MULTISPECIES: hypothetical protein [unclassified Rhizobium]